MTKGLLETAIDNIVREFVFEVVAELVKQRDAHYQMANNFLDRANAEKEPLDSGKFLSHSTRCLGIADGFNRSLGIVNEYTKKQIRRG